MRYEVEAVAPKQPTAGLGVFGGGGWGRVLGVSGPVVVGTGDIVAG